MRKQGKWGNGEMGGGNERDYLSSGRLKRMKEEGNEGGTFMAGEI